MQPGRRLARRDDAAGDAVFFSPRRWQRRGLPARALALAAAVAGSTIGEIGALGGGLVPGTMGLSKQYAGSYAWGFVLFAALALAMLAMLRVMQMRWTRTWAEKGGRARSASPAKLVCAPRTAF